MKLLLSSILAVATMSHVASAQDAAKQVRFGPEPGWVKPSELMPVPADASGLLFVRRNDLLVHLDERGKSQYTGFRIKIIHPNALQLGNISVAWNPAAGDPVVHVVRVHRGSETIDVLKSASFEILRREGNLEQAVLTGELTAVLRVPDLRVGDELEFAATVPSGDPTLGKSEAGVMFVNPEPQAGRFRIGLSWPGDRKPNVRISPLLQPAIQRSEGAFDLRLDNPKAANAPNDAPLRFRLNRIIEFSEYATWPDVSRKFAGLYLSAAKLPKDSPLLKEAARIAAENTDPMARAAAALKLVQQDVRYIYVGLDGGNLTPAKADETWQRRYGDCKGKTVLLLALLNELGIAAEPVLVAANGTDDGMDQRLPSPGHFDHVLVRAKIAGKSYWLDGTLPAVATPNEEPVLAHRWVLPLTPAGSSIVGLPWRPARQPSEITLYEIDARAGFDEPATITWTSIVRGIEGLSQQAQLSSVTPPQLLEAFRQKMIGETFQSIDAAEWRYDVKARASVLRIIGKGKIDWEKQGGEGRSLALPGGGFSPPERRIRASDQDQAAPYAIKPDYSCDVTTVRIPATTKPAQWSLSSSFDTEILGRNYYRTMGLKDGSIRMIRGSRSEKLEIDASSAARDNERIARFDNSKAVVYFEPVGTSIETDRGTPVPATYDFDWLAADVPCLAPDKVHPAGS